MAVPTLTEVFGAAATQTATTITISKADLPTLTASATNTAQQIFVALLLKAQGALNPTARDASTDIKATIDYGGQTIFPIANSTDLDRQDTYTVTLHKTIASVQVDADDY